MFGDYESFLEVVFAVNLLVGAWDGIYNKLSKLRPDLDAFETRESVAVQVDQGIRPTIKRLHDQSEAVRRFFVDFGRTVGVAITILIASMLFVVDSTATVTEGMWWVILSTGVIVPSLMVVMIIVDYGYLLGIKLKAGGALYKTFAAAQDKAGQLADSSGASGPPASPPP